jgi:hypothetical protein
MLAASTGVVLGMTVAAVLFAAWIVPHVGRTGDSEVALVA